MLLVEGDRLRFNRLIPELTVSDLERSKAFYEKLGFKIVYQREEDNFCFIELDGNQLMLQKNNSNWNVGPMEYPYGNGINISMTVDNIEELYARVVDEKLKLFLDLETHSYRVEDKFYDDKEFLIQDPDGYLLRFNN